jgi:hypothetical protein
MAREVRDVDRSRVMAGGVTATNLPQVFKNSLLSSSSSLFHAGMTFLYLIYIFILNILNQVSSGGFLN